MTTSRFSLHTLPSLICLVAASCNAAAADPAKLALGLPLDGKEFTAYSMEFSAAGGHACIAGTDYDETGTSTGRLLLVDLTAKRVAWQAGIAVPDGMAQLIPVQCLVGKDRVYLLANVDSSTSPPQARTRPYLMAFDLHGRQVASTAVRVEGDNQYGYAMGLGDALVVAGYTQSGDEGGERYGTYTWTFDTALRPLGSAVVRMNGAYTAPVGARIVGDNVHLAGRFFGARASMDDTGKFAASRLRAGGGYLWSTPTGQDDDARWQFAVTEDGSSIALGYKGSETTLVRATPQGKLPAPVTYRSAFCRTNALAGFGEGVLAVRRPCSGKGNGLVFIDAGTRTERRLDVVADNPVYVATQGRAWSVMASDKKGKLFLYFSAQGGL